MNRWFRRPADWLAMIGNLFSFFFRLFQYWVLFWLAPHNNILKHLRSLIFLPLKSNCTSGQRFPYQSSIGRLSMVFEVDGQRAKTSRDWLRLQSRPSKKSSTLKPNHCLSEVQTSGRLVQGKIGSMDFFVSNCQCPSIEEPKCCSTEAEPWSCWVFINKFGTANMKFTKDVWLS